MAEKGILVVLSGPSGAGKSTVLGKALSGRTNVAFSTSVTTRAPRPGEVDGKDYFFIDRAKFDSMVENGELLEHAMYVNNGYGTPKAYVEQHLLEGNDVFLDIEIQGARQINEKMPECVKVFIIPPSLEILKERLINRGTETMETINARLERARQEYREADFYDYIIVNDNADTAAEELAAVIRAAHCRASGRKHLLWN